LKGRDVELFGGRRRGFRRRRLFGGLRKGTQLVAKFPRRRRRPRGRRGIVRSLVERRKTVGEPGGRLGPG
jgi:hypothetical protein